MRRVPAGGLEWAVEEWGEGEPVVLLLHGFAGRGLLWREVAGLLPKGLRYLAPDLPGHGATPWPPAGLTFAEVAAGLAELIAALATGPARLLGYSLGGRLALAVAVDYPERVDRLVLESASAGLEDPAERARRAAADDELAAFMVSRGLEAFARAWAAQPLFASQAGLGAELQEIQQQARTSHHPPALAAALRALSPGRQLPLAGRLALVRAPVLLIVGETDAKFRTIADGLARAMPRARTVTIPGAGHNTHLEAPQAFAATAGPFLAGAPRSGGS